MRGMKPCFVVSYIMFALVYYPYLIFVYAVTAGLFVGLGVVLAAVWYAVLLIPSYISFIVVVYKK